MDRRDYYFDRLKVRRYAVTEKKKNDRKNPIKGHGLIIAHQQTGESLNGSKEGEKKEAVSQFIARFQ